MQNAKDTFYVMLQSRLAALNPARTIVVRGVLRPGVLVTENELASASVPVNAFRLEWTGLSVNYGDSLALVAMECTIRYATDGNAGNGGMDRGRLLAGMDAELATVLGAAPQAVAKMNYSAAGAGATPVLMSTNVFWSAPSFGIATAVDERIERAASIQVFAYQEAGEL
jgi:hypothetical protein